MTSTQQLDFQQAMRDFKTMFPGMEDAVIEAVLRSNQGAVDATIDQLLAMNTDYENEQLRHQLDEADGPSKTPDLIQSVAAASSLAGPSGGACGGAVPDNISRLPVHDGKPPLREIKGWDPPMLGQLPDDFLRLTPLHCRKQLQHRGRQLQARWHERRARRRYLRREKHRRRAERAARTYAAFAQSCARTARTTASLFVEGSRAFSQYMAPDLVPQAPEDTMMLSHQMLQARYAENQRVRGVLGDSAADPDLDQFLEDERIALFLQNEEFMAELRWNKDFLTALEKEQCAESPTGELPYKSAGGLHDDDLFREHLRNMGKVSRKKFAQLARMFTGRKKRTAKQILGHSAGPSKDSLLLNSEPLLSAEDEDNESEQSHSQDKHREGSHL
ncbi:CUE domain-containing protein 1 [Frankliniella fusca]|uniref:CUE domain-containing protein 1 n=1 Tax=Frankliniella fusca TaxID=407009 RepID=A0AAE1L7R4_9NEOP|nr:CUE domain-containing protein 1 [Frankliniella fusca]